MGASRSRRSCSTSNRTAAAVNALVVLAISKLAFAGMGLPLWTALPDVPSQRTLLFEPMLTRWMPPPKPWLAATM